MTLQPAAFDAELVATCIADLDHAKATAPLTLIRAWHTETGTSQRRALQQLMDFKTVLVSGGNRSGKTYLLRAALVALALGSDHPHARLFWLNNGCDPDCFPKGPGEAYIVALTSNDSIRYHRKDVAALLPDKGAAPACRWWNKNGKGEGRVEISVPGYDEPAVIWFKSEDQGEEGIQGDAVRAILHDEEGKTDAVWEEASVRLLDHDGWQLMANTPLNGRTWVWEKYVRETPSDVAYCEIWTEHNPFLPPGAVAKLRTKNKAAARTRGQWETAEGLVFDQWSRDRHVCSRRRWAELHPTVPWAADAPHPAFPDDWARFRVQDFGTRNPGCVQWLVMDPDDRVFLYRCIYQAGWLTAQWAAAIYTAEGGSADPETDPATWEHGPEPIELSWADPAALQSILDMSQTYGVDYGPAAKDWKLGRDACLDALALGKDGTPGFMVIEGAAPDFVIEIEGYRYPDRTSGVKNPDEKPIKKNDHAMDAWRYGMVGIRRWAA